MTSSSAFQSMARSATWSRSNLQGREWLTVEGLAGMGLCGFARWFSSARVFGVERLFHDTASRPRVYVANHASHGDFLLLWAALPPALRARVRPVAAADYWERDPVRRYLAREVFRSVLVSRHEMDRYHNPLTAMLRAMDAGDSLILFPEGTRGDGARLQEFRCGVYHLLQERPEVSVVPAWLEGVHRAFPRGSMLPLPLPCAVAFGEARLFDAAQVKQEFLEELRASVEGLGEQCRRWMRES